MATMGAKLALLLGLFMAASLLAAAQPNEVHTNKGTVTIYNPATLAIDIAVDDMNVRVTTQSATLDIIHEEQHLQISSGGGEATDFTVHDGDVLVVTPDPTDAGNPQLFKVVEGGEEPRPEGVPRPPRPSEVVLANFPNVNVPLPDLRP